jgi:hypothetical protein
VRLREIGDAADDQPALVPALPDARRDVLLDDVELHRREELAVGELGQPLGRAAHTDEPLDVVVPRCDVAIADRPVHADAFDDVRLEVDVAPAVAVTSPGERATSDLVAAQPLERLRLDVGAVVLVRPERGVRLVREARAAQHRVLGDQAAGRHAAVRDLPGRRGRVGVVRAMDHVAAALEHESAQPTLRQLLGGQPPGDPGADDDRIEVFSGHAAGRATD